MPVKKYKPLSPDPYVGKIKGDTEFARLAHLNDLVDQVNNNTPTPPTSSYKVYTALLTQSGGDNVQGISNGSLLIGRTYYINYVDGGPDFTNVGAPNNNVGTYFVATGTTPNTWGAVPASFDTLTYNTGAPVVTVLENTIGNIWWTFNNTGSFYINSDGLFSSTSSTLFGSFFSDTIGSGNDAYVFNYIVNSSSQIILYVLRTSDNGYVNVIGGDGRYCPIEIRVYN